MHVSSFPVFTSSISATIRGPPPIPAVVLGTLTVKKKTERQEHDSGTQPERGWLERAAAAAAAAEPAAAVLRPAIASAEPAAAVQATPPL